MCWLTSTAGSLRAPTFGPASTPPFGVVQKQAEQSALLEKAGGMKVADKKIDDFRQLSEIKINLPGYEMLLPKPAK